MVINSCYDAFVLISPDALWQTYGDRLQWKKNLKKNHGEKCKLGKNTVFLYEVGSWFWRRNVQAQLVSPLRNAATSGWKLALLESTLSFLSCWRGEVGAVVSSSGPLWNKMECEEGALGRDGLTRSLNIE